MDDLARIQRRVPWIPARELIGDDSILRAGNAARIMLGYAQSWLLVHYLIKEPAAVPRFRQYLQAIASRVKSDRRIEDAQAHLGDLDRLDRTAPLCHPASTLAAINRFVRKTCLVRKSRRASVRAGTRPESARSMLPGWGEEPRPAIAAELAQGLHHDDDQRNDRARS